MGCNTGPFFKVYACWGTAFSLSCSVRWLAGSSIPFSRIILRLSSVSCQSSSHYCGPSGVSQSLVDRYPSDNYLAAWFQLRLYSSSNVFSFHALPTASSSFMTDAKFPEGRKLLALYPVVLFYLSLTWIVLIGFQQGPSHQGAVAEAELPKGNGTASSTATTVAERLLLESLASSL